MSEIQPWQADSDDGEPAISGWWGYLAIILVALGLGQLGKALVWLFAWPISPGFIIAGVMALLWTMTHAEPKSMGHVALMAAVAAVAGALAIMSYLALTLVSQHILAHLLGIGTASVVALLAAHWLFIRLGVPLRSRPSGSPPNGAS